MRQEAKQFIFLIELCCFPVHWLGSQIVLMANHLMYRQKKFACENCEFYFTKRQLIVFIQKDKMVINICKLAGIKMRQEHSTCNINNTTKRQLIVFIQKDKMIINICKLVGIKMRQEHSTCNINNTSRNL